MIRLILSAIILAVLAPSPSFGSDKFLDFKKYATQKLLKPFAKDLGGVIGAGTFHTGRSLGFPGVDVGGHFGVQTKPDQENEILKNAKIKTFGIPMVQGEIGLPYSFDVILRGISYEKITLVGGGLRYGLFKWAAVPFAPGVAISGFAHSLTHTDFSLSQLSGNIAVDLAIPVIYPYVGFGVDRSRIKVNRANDASIVDTQVSAQGTRATVGINLKPLPLVYLHGAFTSINGNSGYEGGLGVKF
ncbi:MAG: hypothetical protein HY401_01270 [Elusimicrobia bacterium]|nr:hypothetical protein [Elusimicrobiota bacterium]